MGGKTSTSTQGVSIPPAVLAQYQSVVAGANQTAQIPFQQYGGEFVAPVNAEQTQGIAGTNAAATEAQPGYTSAQNTLGTSQNNTTGINDAATGLAAASAGAVDPSTLDASAIDQYMNPYLSTVLGSTSNLLNQNNQEQQSGQLGTAISSGAFGGDRTGIAAANLEQQQNLSNASTYSGIASDAYNNALSTAQQQQGVGLAAGQANRAAIASAGQELSGIGATTYGEGANTASEEGALASGAQTAGLQGANAEIAAGTVQQQTQQAADIAQYNQFLQQQSYPFQVGSWLAGISEGTGALEGSTTTTQQPGGFFSDKRLKHDIKKIGETFDHQDIYSYKMHGDPRTHIGLIAQKVEKKHPEAVGLARGYKIVDYGAATEDAANRGHFYEGGVVPFPRKARASGGPSIVDASDLSAILAAQRGMYAPLSGGASGVYGGEGGSVPRGGSSRVPAPSGATPHLVTASGALRSPSTGAQNTASLLGLAKAGQGLYDEASRPVRRTVTTTSPGGLAPANTAPVGDIDDTQGPPTPSARGGRSGFDEGGDVDFDSLVAAHGQMYGQGASRPQEDIPSGGGTHQLTVASGTPAPPTSGSTNLNTGLGLAQKGYQAYQHFNSPTPSGASPGATDLSGQAASATAPGSDSGTISGIASPVAAPAADAGVSGGAAASGAAADVAGGAAADAAVGAGADAAGTAAAEAAAAIAAEYAAADVGTVALLAAKRGGRIKRDAGGGMPYSDPDGSLDIPDTGGGGGKVQTAGPLVKQPTGLQTLMTLGTQQGAEGAVSGMFSNEALARGGVAAGRRGFDEGGDVDDTDAGPSTVAPTGVAAAAQPLSVDSGPSWWDKNKGKAIPILEGLAAMGTAPTKHLGVALAAGLGAGAQAYVPTQQGLASTQQTEATTKGIDIQNQIAQQKLNYLKAPPPSATPISPLPSQASYAPTDLRKQYYVPPVTQDEAAKLQYAYKQKAAGIGGAPVEAVLEGIKNRVDAQTSANQNDARQNYDDAYSVATKAKDPDLRNSAASVANAYQQWTGDTTEERNGVPTNKRTNQPWIGDEAARVSTQKYADMMNDAMTKIPVPTGVPGETKLMAKWQVNRPDLNSPQDYVASQVPPGTPGLTPPSATPARVPVQRQAAPQAEAPAVTAPQPPVNPVDAKAFSDPKYKLAPVPTQIGTTASDAVTNQVKATSEARANLQADAEQTAQSTGSALQFAQAAKQILDSKGAPVTGFFGPTAKVISSVFGGVNATNYQEVAKYLGNLAVQSGKGNFPHATEKENMVQFNDLSPSVGQTGDALRDLLDTNVRNLQYTMDTANRTTKYLDPKSFGGTGGDPQKFFRWNQEHYPRADVVNPTSSGGPVTIKGKSDYDALPSGAPFVHNGKAGVKP